MQAMDEHLTGLAATDLVQELHVALDAAEVSSLKKSDQLFVKMVGADEWDKVVYVVSKNASTSTGNIEFSAKYTLEDNGDLKPINAGLKQNLPKYGSTAEFDFRRFTQVIWCLCRICAFDQGLIVRCHLGTGSF